MKRKKIAEWCFVVVMAMCFITLGIYAFTTSSTMAAVSCFIGVPALALYAYMVHADKKMLLSITFEDAE